MDNNWHVLQHALESFALTMCLESVVLVLFFQEFRHIQALVICFLVNMVTHPVYFTVRHDIFPHENWLIGVAVLEPLVVVIEALVYRVVMPLPRSKAILAALLANFGSLVVGVLSRVMVGQHRLG